MTAKPVVTLERARRDVEDAIDYYAREEGADLALRFIGALEDGYRMISARPAMGSPRYAHELDLPGFRSRGLRRFPYLVFYVERADRIDIWRVLHAQRDIASWMAE